MRRGHMRVLFAAALILLAVFGMAACGLFSTPRAGYPSRPESPPPASTTPAPAPPPGPAVLAVKIDNVPEARPPVGIGAADVVYVEPVEGGYSRLLGIFASHQPPEIGPVRSARETDAELLPQFGHPTLAYSGAAPELLPLIAAAPVTDASDAHQPAAFTRDESRPVPHNLFVDPSKLPPGAQWPGQNRLTPGPAPGGGTPTGHYEVTFPSATVGFDWSAGEQRWLVSMDGAPYAAVDSGRLGPPTVVIERVKVRESAIHDVAGNPSPIAETVGSGPVTVLRDGRAFNGTWSRPAPDAAATYAGPSGEALLPTSGQVWIVLTP
ncbi:DUF3048 domain-containing protein [Saccharopolyspora pogona]|uniref:DUF3048 domain-containing protein n=1 Tax=Saccharopolyspora pogona TaxID=333966 RepID=UPI001CC23D22|nr:DUF3048 domain-containing protein [Saccharopolyspora pogona]